MGHLTIMEQVAFILWIVATEFILISAILSEIYIRTNNDDLPKFEYDGKRMYRVWRESELKRL